MREAHPGEHLEAHRSMDQKLSAARRLRDEVGITRPILVDDLAGTIHAAYGLLPNMTWVIGRGGMILYKAMWTTADRIDEFLEGWGSGPPIGMVPSPVEQLEWRRRDMDAFMARLPVNGPRSHSEFVRAMEVWAARAKEEAERLREARRKT